MGFKVICQVEKGLLKGVANVQEIFLKLKKFVSKTSFSVVLAKRLDSVRVEVFCCGFI